MLGGRAKHRQIGAVRKELRELNSSRSIFGGWRTLHREASAAICTESVLSIDSYPSHCSRPDPDCRELPYSEMVEFAVDVDASSLSM